MRKIFQEQILHQLPTPGQDLTNTVYALGPMSIDFCLSVFPWAHLRTTKTVVFLTNNFKLPAATI